MSVPACFPAPLPDETLYSIFCRYHVRSCNLRDASILQLFDGHRPSMHTTMLSPYPLRYARSWTDSFYGISAESLALMHTALPFYRAFNRFTSKRLSDYSFFSYCIKMYINCCTPTKRLRYCPKCARSQWDTFGTSYWQILPQIRGYEICLLHNEPIRETEISHHDIAHKFFPASSAIANHSACEDTGRLHMIEKHWEEYLQQAQDINYIFRCSNPDLHFPKNFCNILVNDMLPVNPDWLQKIVDDDFLAEDDDLPDIDYLLDVFKDTSSLISRFRFLPICLQLYICRIMFGNIQKVCNISNII